MRTPFAVATFAVVALAAGSARAQVMLPITQVPDGTVHVDGSTREWHVPFTSVGHGDDAQLDFALGYDDGGLYVAARVADDRVVRTSSPGRDEDAIIVTLALPEGTRLRGTDVWLFSGVTGRSAAVAMTADAGGARLTRAGAVQVVEGPRTDRRHGYQLEAYVPWRTLPGGARWQEGRGAVRLRDVDQEAHPTVESEPSTANVDAAHLDRLPPIHASGGASGMLGQFLASQGIDGRAPRFDLRGDVAGDARPERVAIVDRYVFVAGEGYRGGTSYSFLALPVDSAPAVLSAELAELTGDGKKELVLTLRQTDTLGSRVLWEAIGITDDGLRPLVAIETRKEPVSGGAVTATVEVRGGAIVSRPGTASAVDASSWHDTPARDASPILLPWGTIASRTFRWSASGFLPTDETRPAPDAGVRVPVTAPVANGADTSVPAPPPPPPSTDQLVAAFRAAQHVAPNVRARFDQGANVAGTAAPERVLVLGRAAVIVGPGIQGGTGYAFLDLPAQTDADVLDVRCDDVTGDGHAELLVRVAQALGDVRRETLVVYGVSDRGVRPMLSAEVARARGTDRVDVAVRVVGQGAQRHLELAPGTAHGWTEQSYPFVSEPSAPGLDALVLPWASGARRYRLDGARLVGR